MPQPFLFQMKKKAHTIIKFYSPIQFPHVFSGCVFVYLHLTENRSSHCQWIILNAPKSRHWLGFHKKWSYVYAFTHQSHFCHGKSKETVGAATLFFFFCFCLFFFSFFLIWWSGLYTSFLSFLPFFKTHFLSFLSFPFPSLIVLLIIKCLCVAWNLTYLMPTAMENFTKTRGHYVYS